MSGRNHSFNPYVHGSRGLFSGMIFFYHVINSGLPTFAPVAGGPGLFALYSLQAGVELFFGISGFVIAGALMRAPSAPAFLWERMTRIYPVLWVSILVIAGAALAFHVPVQNFPDFTAHPVLFGLNFLAPPPFFQVPKIHPAAWSLGYEFTFYFLCAAAVFLPKSWRKVSTPLLLALSTVLLIAFPRGLMFVIGLWIASGRFTPPLLMRLARYPFVFLVLFLLCWCGLRMLDPSHSAANLTPFDMGFARWGLVLPLLLLTTLIGGVSLFGVAQGHGLLARVLKSPLMQWAGTISYSFYLWHPIVLGVVKKLIKMGGVPHMAGPWTQVLFALIALPIALAISAVSTNLLEKRVTLALRHFRRKTAAPPATVNAEV